VAAVNKGGHGRGADLAVRMRPARAQGSGKGTCGMRVSASMAAAITNGVPAASASAMTFSSPG
jgi:hypothetical protein